MHYTLLSAGDASKVDELMRMFAEAFEDSATYSPKRPEASYTERLLSNPRNIVIGASTEEGTIVGGIVAYELQKFEQERSEIYLYDLAVAPAYRRQGIASQLIAELQSLAKERNAHVIFVQADNEDVGAVALYTKLATSIEGEVTHFDIPVT